MILDGDLISRGLSLHSSEDIRREAHRRTGDFLALLSKHEWRLRAFILALIPHWNDAEEVLQETRAILWEKFDEYDPAKDFGGWSRAIAYYQVLALREKTGRLPRLVDTEFLQLVAEEFDAQADRVGVQLQFLEGCLEKLDTVKRQLLLRYYSGSESMAEISASCGRSLDAIKHSILRSRQLLAECIERQQRREMRP